MNSTGRRNLFNMIRFAEVFPTPDIVQTLSAQLGWSHFLEIIALKDPLQRALTGWLFPSRLSRVSIL